MVLARLELTEFRNYESLRLDLPAPLCLFTGDNAQGKTNILEAILLLAYGRSPRTTRDGEVVRWNAREAVVRAEVDRRVRSPVSISLSLQRNGSKRIKVDGVPRKRVVDAVGEVNAVLFGPDQLELVGGAPSQRRRFLNTCLGQTSPKYLGALAGYRNVLRQRNTLLRDAGGREPDPDLLLTYDDQLADHAGVLMAVRAERVVALAAQAAELHARFSGGREQLQVSYAPDLALPAELTAAALADALREQLIGKRTAEFRRGVTLVGPHRDDLKLEIDGREARSFASQGQQRTAALALKVAELRIIAEAIGEPPLLLLDDVTSELDEHRREEVMALSDEAEQVLITGSQLGVFSAAVRSRATVFEVVSGTVRPRASEVSP